MLPQEYLTKARDPDRKHNRTQSEVGEVQGIVSGNFVSGYMDGEGGMGDERQEGTHEVRGGGEVTCHCWAEAAAWNLDSPVPDNVPIGPAGGTWTRSNCSSREEVAGNRVAGGGRSGRIHWPLLRAGVLIVLALASWVEEGLSEKRKPCTIFPSATMYIYLIHYFRMHLLLFTKYE